jgi:hypothetical protein
MFATPVCPKRLLASIEQETEALIQPKTEVLDGSEPGQLRLKEPPRARERYEWTPNGPSTPASIRTDSSMA